MIRTSSRWGSQWKTAEIPCQHNIKEEKWYFFLEKHPEIVLGNTFCAYLLQQFLSAGEDRHEPIISLGKVTELSFQRWWKIRERSNGGSLLAPFPWPRNPPHVCRRAGTYSGSSAGCSEGGLRLQPVDMLSSWLAMALMLVSATTWATGMQGNTVWRISCWLFSPSKL